MSIEHLREMSNNEYGLNLIQEYKNNLTIRQIAKKYNLSRAI